MKGSLEKERERYSQKASQELLKAANSTSLEDGIQGIPKIHHEPYLFYYHSIQQIIEPHCKVLEIAAGTGRHTNKIVQTGAKTTALDISGVALQVLKKRTNGMVDVVCAPMDEMPFPSNTFDYVLTCGGLSYADNEKLLDEILRTLKPGGGLIFLDSLNHNPIYRLNRFLRFLRNDRTFSTLRRMPTLAFIDLISSHFDIYSLRVFGKTLWIKQLLQKFGIQSDPKILARLEESIDARYAFKFVLICRNFRG